VTVVAWYSDIGESWNAIETARPAPLAPATLLGVLSVSLAAVGVTLVGRAVSDELGWLAGIKGFCLAWVLGFFLGRVSVALSRPLAAVRATRSSPPRPSRANGCRSGGC
jgi:hypothetical protein